MTIQPDLLLRDQVIIWMDAAGSVFHNSEWSQVLSIDGIDVWDALRSPLYLALLHLARELNYSPDLITQSSQQPQGSAIAWLRARLQIGQKWQAYRIRDISGIPQLSDVVFWPREPTHIKVQVPVAKELLALGISATFIANKPKVVRDIHGRGFPVTYTHSAWSSEIRSARNKCQRMLNDYDRLPILSLPDFPVQCENMLVFDYLRRKIVQLMPSVCENLVITDLLVNHIRPNVLVVGNDLTLEGRTATLRALFKSLPTASIMHGNVLGILHNYHIVDKYMVFGPGDKRRLTENRVPATRVTVTGPPYLDGLHLQTHRFHPIIQRKLNLSTSRPVVLVAMSGSGDSVSLQHHLRMIEYLMRLSAELVDVTFVAKLHRKDRLEHYMCVRSQVIDDKLVIIPSDEPGYPSDIFDWLRGVSLVITGASTVAVEAMLMQVPVVTMDFMDELRNIHFIDSGATHHVRSFDALRSTVDTLLSEISSYTQHPTHRNAQNMIQDMFGSLDGKSSQRAASVILDMISNR